MVVWVQPYFLYNYVALPCECDFQSKNTLLAYTFNGQSWHYLNYLDNALKYKKCEKKWL